MSQNKNPYSQAAGAYGNQAKATDDQRELEAQALIKAAAEMQNLIDHWDEVTPEDLDNVVSYNRKLWMLFFDAAVENPDDRPLSLRNNIVNLCNFIFKRGLDILADPKPEKFTVIIEVNREIAAGLRTSLQNNPELQPAKNEDILNPKNPQFNKNDSAEPAKKSSGDGSDNTSIDA